MYTGHGPIKKGDVVGIDVGLGPLKLATGVVVPESDAHSFTLMAPEGHAFAGVNTMFAVDDGDGFTRARVSIVIRASDPLYELGLLWGGHRQEEQFWAHHLRNLAGEFGQTPPVRLIRRRLDRHGQWKNAKNVRTDAVLRSLVRRIPGVEV